jgi:hypothetical protein
MTHISGAFQVLASIQPSLHMRPSVRDASGFFSRTCKRTVYRYIKTKKKVNNCPSIEKDTTHKHTHQHTNADTHSMGQEATQPQSEHHLTSTTHPMTKLHLEPPVRGRGAAKAPGLPPPPAVPPNL